MTKSQTRGGRWSALSILAVIAGFAIWWPLGLSALAYILWPGPIDGLADEAWSRIRTMSFWSPTPKKTGNAAFDAYKAETLKRLEAEQAAFADYLVKLREARDREEFERFMTERKTQSAD
jgi:hypothetical protein